MAYLRETPEWPEYIYLIERHDPLMGGEYGINNIQARQLACRTLWLLKSLLAEHLPDGGHLLDQRHFAENAGITENKLDLDFPTGPMRAEADRLAGILQAQTESLEKLSLLDGSLFGPLCQALRLAWRYGYPRLSFELFSAAFTMRPAFAGTNLVESISGDDSIDVEDSSQLAAGETYVLWDGERCGFVTVRDILTEKRVILWGTEETTRLNTGRLVCTNWVPGAWGLISAQVGSKYVSREISVLDGTAGGKLVIVHTGDAAFTVEIQHGGMSGKGLWERAAFIGRMRSSRPNLNKSAWQIPGTAFKFRITALADTGIDHLVIVSADAGESITPIRTPRVLDNDFTIARYGAVYGIQHGCTRFELSQSCDFVNDCQALEFGPDTSPLPVWDYRKRVLSMLPELSPGDAYWWRARYFSACGQASCYSTVGHYTHPDTKRPENIYG